MTSSIVNVSNQSEEETAFVVKVYRSDQTFKYFPVHKVTQDRTINVEFIGFCSGNDVETISDAGDHRIRYYRAEQVRLNDVERNVKIQHDTREHPFLVSLLMFSICRGKKFW